MNELGEGNPTFRIKISTSHRDCRLGVSCWNSLSRFTVLDQNLSLQSYHPVFVQPTPSQGRNHHYLLCNLILLAKIRNHEMPKHLHLYHHRPHCHGHYRHHQHRRHPQVVPIPTCERISLQRRTVSSVFRWLYRSN